MEIILKMTQKNIIHCNLTPSNIIIRQDYHITLINFSSAVCYSTTIQLDVGDDFKSMLDGISTSAKIGNNVMVNDIRPPREYESEIIFSSTKPTSINVCIFYAMQDTWCVGLILLEMINRRRLIYYIDRVTRREVIKNFKIPSGTIFEEELQILLRKGEKYENIASPLLQNKELQRIFVNYHI